jgi:hypothetical protein
MSWKGASARPLSFGAIVILQLRNQVDEMNVRNTCCLRLNIQKVKDF